MYKIYGKFQDRMWVELDIFSKLRDAELMMEEYRQTLGTDWILEIRKGR